MNKSLYLAALIALFSTSAFVACKSKMEGTDNTETTTITDSVTITQDAVSGVKDDARQLANDTIVYSDWSAFKTESEKMIDNNNARIQVLKAKIRKPGMPNLDKLREKRIDEIQERNAALRARVAVYNRTQTKAEWEAYKADFQKDLDALNKSIDELNTADKK